MIIQQWVPYGEWEDFKNGMWRKLPTSLEPEMIDLAIEFTGKWVDYGNAMGEVIIEWPKTMINSLSNSSINRRAFLGHCACQFKHNIPEYITRIAWRELTDQQRFDADKIAEIHIKNWLKNYEVKNRKVHKGMGEQMLLQWPT